MTYLIIKIFLTALLIVVISEVAKLNDKLGETSKRKSVSDP